MSIITILVGRSLGITPHDIKLFVNSFGIFAPVAYSLILFLGLSVPFNPISDFLVVNIAALLFPPLVSVIFTFIAHVFSLTVNYYVAQKYGLSIIGAIAAKDKTNSIIKLSKKLTFGRIFLLRFVLPTSNFIGSDILSYLSGIQKMPFLKFFIISIIPWTILNILFFYSTSILLKKSIPIYFFSVFLIIGLPVAILIFRKKAVVRKHK